MPACQSSGHLKRPSHLSIKKTSHRTQLQIPITNIIIVVVVIVVAAVVVIAIVINIVGSGGALGDEVAHCRTWWCIG